VSASVANKV